MTKQPGSIFSVDVTGLETAIGEPAYARICDRIRSAITSGALAPNARLPSSRMLARDFRVARNTVDSALGRYGGDYWEYGASNGLTALREAIAALPSLSA